MLLDGKKVAAKVEEYAKNFIGDGKPSITFFVVGEDAATDIYVRNKRNACERVGIESEVLNFADDVKEEHLIEEIHKMNKSDTTGIIVQLPLPVHINEDKVLGAIDTEKDVDCMHPENLGRLFFSSDLIPCTTAGILRLIEETGTGVKGKNIVVINRKHIGKSLATILINRKATVAVCGRNTDLEKFTKDADIVVTAAGCPGLIKKSMLKPGVIVIDVGISRINGKIKGDADEDVKDIASYVTPVPGGVGPMTVAMLMKNTAEMYKKHNI